MNDAHRQRLERIKQRTQEAHRVELSQQQVLLMVFLCGLDHLEGKEPVDAE